MSPQKSLYTILGVTPDANEEDVRRAFRRLAHASHPDTSGVSTDDTAEFREIIEAYRVLSDPIARAEYDRTLATPRSPSWRRIDVRTVAATGRTDDRDSGCPTCHGRRRIPATTRCSDCAGAGTVVELGIHRARPRPCADCGGAGRVRTWVACPDCASP